MNLLFYDDDVYGEENKIFDQKIRGNLPEINFVWAGSFDAFEKWIRKGPWQVIILDIMGAETNITSYKDSRTIVNSRYIGIEIIERIRGRYYEKQPSNVPIIIRSARADEDDTILTCKKLGVDHIFLPGDYDLQIIEILKEINDNHR